VKNKLVFALITIIVVILALSVGNVCANDASIGIIGGADGPTAIFIAGPNLSWLTIAVSTILIIAIVILVIKKLKNK
jgi:Na+-transporting methylmalonyl-CoA/oxaloacetate decarboxylase beta subunit